MNNSQQKKSLQDTTSRLSHLVINNFLSRVDFSVLVLQLNVWWFLSIINRNLIQKKNILKIERHQKNFLIFARYWELRTDIISIDLHVFSLRWENFPSPMKWCCHVTFSSLCISVMIVKGVVFAFFSLTFFSLWKFSIWIFDNF